MKELKQPVVRRWLDYVVIAFFALMLIFMCIAAIGPTRPKFPKSFGYKTEGRLKALQTGLDGYKAEYGSYPICEDPEEGTTVLYMTLFGDYNGNGMPDHFPEDEDDPDVKTFMEKLRPPTLDEHGKPTGGPSMVMPVASSYAVVDVWGEPFYYINLKPGTDPQVPFGGGKYNSGGSYDLWSTGNDPDPSDDDRSMWIKNW